MALTASFALTATGTLTKDDLVSVVNDSVSSGSKSFPDMLFSLSDGSGDGQASSWFRKYLTIAAGATTSLDLSGGTETDPFGTALSLTNVKTFVVAIVDPDGTKAVRVGPQSVANTFVGPFGCTSFYTLVPYWSVHVNPSAAGWTVVAGTQDKFALNNPGATSVDVVVWIIGS